MQHYHTGLAKFITKLHMTIIIYYIMLTTITYQLSVTFVSLVRVKKNYLYLSKTNGTSD